MSDIIQTKAAAGTGVSSQAVTMDSPLTGGNSVVVFVAGLDISAGGHHNLSVTDDQGNTYNLEAFQDSNSSTGTVAMFLATGITGGGTVLTAHDSTGTVDYLSIFVYETVPVSFDQSVGGSSNGTSTDLGNLTPPSQPVLGIMGAASGNAATVPLVFAPGSGWDQVDQETSVTSTRKWGGATESEQRTNTSAFDGSISWTNTTSFGAAIFATFLASAAPTTEDVTHNVDADIQVQTDKTHNIDADIQLQKDKTHNVDAYLSLPNFDKSHNVDCYVFIPPQVSETHNVDAFILGTGSKQHSVDVYVTVPIPPPELTHSVDAFLNFATTSFVNLKAGIIFRIPVNGYIKLAGTLAPSQLSLVRLTATMIGSNRSFVNLTGTIRTAARAYVKLAGNISSDKIPTHSVDADISAFGRSFVQMEGTIVGQNSPGVCTAFPDASFVNLAAWIVIPGESVQMPNSGFSAAEDFLSSQIALAAYKPISIISLAGFNLIVTAFTTGVLSWQTRARSWLTRQDEAPNGILLTTTTSVHKLPNGAEITTTTQVFLIQDQTKTIVTIQNSATPERTSVIVTEKTQSGQTITRESDTTTINGVRNTLTKKSVYTQPPQTDNIQPITVRTLDGVTHYQFFGQENTEWSGGEQEGLTTTEQQQSIVPGTLNGQSVDVFGNPILTRVTNVIETDPDGKTIETQTSETGTINVGTTTTDTEDNFNGIVETTKVITTYPDGSQEVKTIVKNSITGDTVETDTETVTDEYGQVTTTVTEIDTKTFKDPVTGALRTTVTKTQTVTKSGVSTSDITTQTTDNFEDSIVNDKIKVIFIQEFTVTCVIDEPTMFALWEINEDHQKMYALQELFGQQLGNATLSYALRQRLITQFNAANCVPCVPLQANGKNWCVVFAPSASAFRAKQILGTEPHVYELQMIVQARSNLVDGTVGF